MPTEGSDERGRLAAWKARHFGCCQAVTCPHCCALRSLPRPACLARRSGDASLLPPAGRRHHVYLLPPLAPPCNIVGFAYIGCEGTTGCRAWVGSNYWTSPQVRGFWPLQRVQAERCLGSMSASLPEWAPLPCCPAALPPCGCLAWWRSRGATCPPTNLPSSFGAGAGSRDGPWPVPAPRRSGGARRPPRRIRRRQLCPGEGHLQRASEAKLGCRVPGSAPVNCSTCCPPLPLLARHARRATAAPPAAGTRRTPGSWAGSACSSWTAAAWRRGRR